MSFAEMLFPRGIYSHTPPPARSKDDNMPTLLYSWWCTIFALVAILVRICGRFVRNEMLFREDKIMALAIIPLLVRMAFIHVVLIWDTNNAALSPDISDLEIYHREIGSKLVLAARIFYALYIWIAKFTVMEFLRRMTDRFWRRSYELGMRFITWYLVATFFAVVISTIAECHPITHYWQVLPDPGSHCREAAAQLITMGAADITTDVLIVGFPIPVILASAMPLKRKINLTFLFSLSILLIVITAYRVPAVIAHKGRQQYRTVWASSEILAAAAVSNAVVLGSFLRDRGLKKTKYKFGSMTDSIDRPSTRRPTVANRHWGSDEDLVADMGYRLDPELQSFPNEPRPAGPVSPPPMHKREDSDVTPINTRDWQFPHGHSDSSRESEDSGFRHYRTPSPFSPRTVVDPMPSPRQIVHPQSNTSFFDIGGLLDSSSQSRRSSTTVVPSPTPTNPNYHTNGQQPDHLTGPYSRRGSRSLLSDLGGILLPVSGRTGRQLENGSRWPLEGVEEHEMTSRPRPPLETNVSQPQTRSTRPPNPSLNTALSAPPTTQPSIATFSPYTIPPTGVMSPHIPLEPGSPMSLQDAGGLLTTNTLMTNTTMTTNGTGYFTPPSHRSASHASIGTSTPGAQTPRAGEQQLPLAEQAAQQFTATPLFPTAERAVSPPAPSPNFSRPQLGRRAGSSSGGSGSEGRSVRFENG